MQAVHIPLPIRQHRRWLAGIRAPEVDGPWYERLLRSAWTYILISALCLYAGCLRGMYVEMFAEPRSRSTGPIEPSRIAWFNGIFVGVGLALVALIGAGWLILRHLTRTRRIVALSIVMALLAGLGAYAFLALIRPIHPANVALFPGLHGRGPYALYELAISWALLTALAGFALWLLLRRRPSRPWLSYIAALLVVALAVGAFWACQDAMTANVAITSAADLWSKVQQYAGYAGWTLLFWVVLFLLVDRWRPQGLIVWFLAVGWGASVATYVSMFVNTWVGQMMAVSTTGPGVQVAPAIYSAPFVEESAKASVLFLLAASLRNRLITRQSVFTLAGLSAAGFAFTENIVYYIRSWARAAADPTIPDPDAYAMQLVRLRGIYTAFGHESFTALTAIGITTALMTRSKTVRILAPASGFLMAAWGHMLFNGSSGFVPDDDRMKWVYLGIGCVIVAIMLGMSFLNWFRDGKRIRARLTDYVRMGWLRPTDVRDYGTAAGRWDVMWASLLRWPPRPSGFVGTWRMIHAMTELAFLRDAMCRGLVNDAGLEREKELFAKIRGLRATALDRSSTVQPPQAIAPVFGAPPAYVPGYPGTDRPWGQTA